MKKGFIITGIIYSMFLLFVMVLLGNLTFQLMTSKISRGRNASVKYSSNINVFSYNNNFQTFTATKAGWYKIELWGAGGNIPNSYCTSGTGAYTSGYINLAVDDKLYVYLGAAGNRTDAANSFNNSNSAGKYFGGGATDIRLTSGNWYDATSLKSRIMVAGAGGSCSTGARTNGGSAGGLISFDGTQQLATNSPAGKKASQKAGGAAGDSQGYSTWINMTAGAFGTGGRGTDAYGGGGGAGWYGGGGAGVWSGNYATGAGGTSYISGYAGVNSLDASGNHNLNTKHSSGKYFINTVMKSGKEEMPNFAGTGTMIGNTSNGYAKITYIGTDAPTRVNTKLNNVRYIKDCINGNNINGNNHWVELQAIYQGENKAKGKVPSYTIAEAATAPYSRLTDGEIDTSLYAATTVIGLQCLWVDLGQTYNLDEIAIWHYYNDGRSYTNNTLSVGNTLVTGVSPLSQKLIDNNSSTSEISQGFHFNAYQ